MISINNGSDLLLLSKEVDPRNTTNCKTILETNMAFALAPGWVNIPETILLNICISTILLVAFKILIYIAWSKSSLSKEFVENGWIQFLYGYRDPERWVALPRFEFIHRTRRHHQHEANYPYLYMSPQLMAYDADSILRKKSTLRDELDDVTTEQEEQEEQEQQKTLKQQQQKQPLTLKQQQQLLEQQQLLQQQRQQLRQQEHQSRIVIGGVLRAKPLYIRRAKRGNLNLPYSKDPLINPQSSANRNGKLTDDPLMNSSMNKSIGSGVIPRIASAYMNQLVGPMVDSEEEGQVDDDRENELSKRSKLSLEDDEAIENIYVIIDHLTHVSIANSLNCYIVISH